MKNKFTMKFNINSNVSIQQILVIGQLYYLLYGLHDVLLEAGKLWWTSLEATLSLASHVGTDQSHHIHLPKSFPQYLKHVVKTCNKQ